MQLPTATRQAPDAESAAADGENSKRKQVSKRLFLNTQGTEVDKMEEATGARYVLLGASGNKSFDQQFGNAGELATMCAIFGYHTKLGNVANSVLNDKDEPGTPDDAAEAITAFLGASPFVWAERTGGGVGVRVDKDALAGAIVEVALATGKLDAAARDDKYAAIRQRLEEDPQYVRAARSVPQVAQAYATRVGKATKTVDDLLA
jgi:hypothetical protein